MVVVAHQSRPVDDETLQRADQTETGAVESRASPAGGKLVKSNCKSLDCFNEVSHNRTSIDTKLS